MKKLLVVSGVVLALTIPLSAFAATSQSPAAQAIRGFCGVDNSKLTKITVHAWSGKRLISTVWQSKARKG